MRFQGGRDNTRYWSFWQRGWCRTKGSTAIRRRRHIGDFSNWRDHAAYEAAFQRLLRDLKARQSNPEGA